MAQQLDQPDYIELIPLRRGAQSAQTSSQLRSWPAIRAILRRKALFLALFALPFSLSVVYFGLLLAPRYASEVQFTVRKAAPRTDELSQVVDNSGHREANLIQAYVLSRDALDHLQSTIDIRAIFARPEADPFWRFPSFFSRDSKEAMFEHYLSFVHAEYDEDTSISRWEVQAFRPEDAVAVIDGLLNGAELLINNFNEKVRMDILRASQMEIALARRKSEQALAALTEYRIKSGMVDPSADSAVVITTIGELSLQRTRLQAELIERMSASPNNPQIESLRKSISALEAQIAAERSRIGGVDEALAGQIAEFERLALEREFSDHALAAAYASQESARREAQSERLYIQMVATPREVDRAQYPRRLLSILVAFAGFFAVYWIVSTVVANFRSHSTH